MGLDTETSWRSVSARQTRGQIKFFIFIACKSCSLNIRSPRTRPAISLSAPLEFRPDCLKSTAQQSNQGARSV